VQSPFRNSPLIPQGGGFVDHIGEEGKNAGNDIKHENANGQAANDNRSKHQAQKTNCKQGRQFAAARRLGLNGALANKRNHIRLGASFAIDAEFVRDEFVSCWPAAPAGKGIEMNENLLSTTVGRDEAKAFVILPGGDSTLVAHIDSMKWAVTKAQQHTPSE
jgi:hypothetical protein